MNAVGSLGVGNQEDHVENETSEVKTLRFERLVVGGDFAGCLKNIPVALNGQIRWLMPPSQYFGG